MFGGALTFSVSGGQNGSNSSSINDIVGGGCLDLARKPEEPA